MSESFLADRVVLHCGDCREVLATLAENSLDACVTDPPYHLTSTVATIRSAFPGRYAGTPGAAVGFMGKVWDGGDVAFRPETWAAVYRVLKPGAHLVACGGTRTYHRMACAIEDAGFEIRDTVSWLYGSGFPKSHDVSKGIDRAAGEQRERIRGVRSGVVQSVYAQDAWSKEFKDSVLSSEPITDAAREWKGWHTALKPAQELIVLARKPLSEGTVAANVLRWGTGAINVDGCRVGTEAVSVHGYKGNSFSQSYKEQGTQPELDAYKTVVGRWPANVVLSVPEDEYELKPFATSEEKRELFRWLSENA